MASQWFCAFLCCLEDEQAYFKDVFCFDKLAGDLGFVKGC